MNREGVKTWEDFPEEQLIEEIVKALENNTGMFLKDDEAYSAVNGTEKMAGEIKIEDDYVFVEFYIQRAIDAPPKVMLIRE